MKYIYTLLITSILLASCGDGSKKSVDNIIAEGNLDKLRAKRTEVISQHDAIGAELEKLDNAISELDTIKNLALVTTIKVKDTLFNHYVELQGNVNTKQNLVIYSEYSGTLIRVLVKKGQDVKKGQLLAKIDDGGLGAQLAQLQVQADLAKTTFDRQNRLWEQKIGSEIQFLQSKAQYESSKNVVSQLKSQIAKSAVIAPFSGTIDDIMAEQGTNVSPGNPIMRIVNLSDMYIESEVPEKYVSNIKKGTIVKAEFPVLNDVVDTKVRQVSNYINPANRAFKIEVAVPNHKGLIKPNLTAKIQLNDYTSENAILIPQSIISENAEGDQYVYKISELNDKGEGDSHRVIIKTGRAQGDFIEVVEGVENGDQLIKEGARSVQEGQKVIVKNN